MTILLNRQTLSRDLETDRFKLPELVRLLRHPRMDHIRIFGEDYEYLRSCFRKCYGDATGNSYFRTYFHRPFAGESLTPQVRARMAVYDYSARLAQEEGTSFPVDDLAMASLLGGISVGLKDSDQGNGAEYRVVETAKASGQGQREFSALMIVTSDQVSNPSYLRWYFSGHEHDLDSHDGMFKLAADYHKHFAVSAKKYGNIPLARQPWVASTEENRSKEKTSLFRPGICEHGPRVRTFIAMLLHEAYAHQCYLAEDQNGTTIDVGEIIGASDGDLTTRIALYVSDQGDVHIRPI